MKICEVDGCYKPATRTKKTYCEMHYCRLRSGKPLNDPVALRGNTECYVDGCDKKPSGKYCSMHNARVLRHGDVNTVIHQRDRNLPRREAHPGWRGDNAKYNAVHDRLRKWVGKASKCVYCEGDGPYQWAYDWQNASMRVEENGMPYSTNTDDYIELCIPCHKNYDLSRPALTTASS